ncbi:MAG: EF-P lysine aminoacylase EpmA [Syntrophobacteraceae bacterium]
MDEREELAGKRPLLELRSLVTNAIRAFFEADGFLEVQTPLLTSAPAPEAHIDAVPAGVGRFLITSPELYMKRLLAAGYSKIFQISPVFRQEEQGRYHHPEFTLLEWYRSNADYKDLQQDCKNLLASVCEACGFMPGRYYRGQWIEVTGPWQHYTVREAFLRFAGWEPASDVDQDLFDLALVEKVEPNIGFPGPCILADYPVNQAALAKIKPGNPPVAERFELYWAGLELANGFSELRDPKEQRSRFEEAREVRRLHGLQDYPMPESFLKSLEHLPPCAGIALGVDRLVTLLSGADHIDMVVAFPPHIEQ